MTFCFAISAGAHSMISNDFRIENWFFRHFSDMKSPITEHERHATNLFSVFYYKNICLYFFFYFTRGDPADIILLGK